MTYERRRVAADWPKLLSITYQLAARSQDPSSQVGALLADDDGFVSLPDGSTGHFNRLPRGVLDLPERWERPLKYKIVEHAERVAIYTHARHGVATAGLTMVCNWAACTDCARAIIEGGLRRLVTHRQALDRSPPGWAADVALAHKLLEEAGVEVLIHDGPVGGPPIRQSGEVWQP